MLSRSFFVTLVLAITANAGATTITKVQGRIVDGNGGPVAGTRIAQLWVADEAKPLEPVRPAVSGKDGRFSLEIEIDDGDLAVMAIDATGMLGGVAKVRARSPGEPIEISLAPLAETRVRYTSESADRSLGLTYVTWSVGGEGQRVAVAHSRTPVYEMKLPPGRYFVEASESLHLDDVREVTLEADKLLDLGEIRLPLTALTRLFGKPAPAWHITDARGVSKEAQPGDFKGKWVVLEFWGYWCGACVQRGLPGWMDFTDDHAADRDKFVVLSVHDPKATSLAMLDEKMVPIIRRTWRGKPLPFPILLDTSGRFVEEYGVSSWPTAVLLDPEGRVVEIPAKYGLLGSWACEAFLASKLTPLPVEKRILRTLDRCHSLSVDETTLGVLLRFYGEVSGTAIRLDLDALQAAGINDEIKVPLRASGTLTLRAWLNLSLEPFNLTYVADDDALRVVRRTSDNFGLAQPSARQKDEMVLVAEALRKKVTFDFKGESLKQVIATLESKTEETFLIDPACRKAGTIDPEIAVSGSADDEQLSSALTRLLSPLGLAFVIRSEVIIFTPGP